MHRIRARYMRGEELKFISHLDLARTFERALNRGEIPAAYSEGFHPHPKISIAAPLAVGVTSEDEYADFDLSRDMSAEEFRERMNRSLPSGLSILDAKKVDVGGESLMSGIARADYVVSFVLASGEERLRDFVEKALLADKLMIEKDTNKGAKLVDIRPLIYGLEVLEVVEETSEKIESRTDEPGQSGECRQSGLSEQSVQSGQDEQNVQSKQSGQGVDIVSSGRKIAKLKMSLASGSRANLRPDLVISLLEKEGIADTGEMVPSIHRTALYSLKGKDFVTPFEF